MKIRNCLYQNSFLSFFLSLSFFFSFLKIHLLVEGPTEEPSKTATHLLLLLFTLLGEEWGVFGSYPVLPLVAGKNKNAALHSEEILKAFERTYLSLQPAPCSLFLP